MIDAIFKKIDEHGLADWGVIYYGVVGVPGVAGRLSNSLLNKFASDKLEGLSIEDPLLGGVVEIATEANSDSRELRLNLEKICHAYSVDLKRSLRVWRCVSLEISLLRLSSDPVYGLIALSEFWAAWGWPEDAPSSMQNRSNKMSEQEYHSQSNYIDVIKNHEEWLAAEVMSL